MLVIISDLHLTDGTSGELIDEKAFRIFRNRVGDMAYDASWRSGGGRRRATGGAAAGAGAGGASAGVGAAAADVGAAVAGAAAGADGGENVVGFYRPLEELDIVLLGDIIDMIRSEKWNDQPEINMPWTSDRSNAFFAQLSEIVDGVLENNKKSFAILRDIAQTGIKIPRSMRILTEEEKVSRKIGSEASAEKATVKVNIYYMVGNHDWFLYIDDPRMNAIRNRIIDALGLVNQRDTRFPYFRNENTALEQCQNDHHVYAVHGDIFDKTNYQSSGRDQSSVGDVVVLKLLNEIPRQIEKQIGQFPADKIGSIPNIALFINELREIDNLRPYALAPLWISALIKKYDLDIGSVNTSIRDALRQLLRDFTDNPLISREHLVVIEMKITGLLLQREVTIESLASLVQHLWLSKDNFETYRAYARTLTTNDAGMNKTFFVMGHTHYPEIVPMSSCTVDGQVVGQIYMNTGTWRPLHKTGIYDNSFISLNTMTIAGFYKGNERMGHSFEYWTGSLDL